MPPGYGRAMKKHGAARGREPRLEHFISRSPMFVTDSEVAQAITMTEAVEAMHAAFVDLGRNGSAVQDRVRIHAGGASLSMMGGIYGAEGVMGAKVYPTVDGQFDFVIPLFSSSTGKLLRVVQGNQLTRLRTAAVTRIAVDAVVPAGARRLAIFGSGVQARAHAEAFALGGRASEVLVCAIEGAQDFAEEIRQRHGVPARAVEARQAVEAADVVITATRASTPLFEGSWLRPGAFVAAIGSSKPTTREVDDLTLHRASRVIVESRAQAMREAGDLVMAADAQSLSAKVIELGALLVDPGHRPGGEGDVTLYKSVGIGLEDVALACHVHRKLPLAA